MNDLIELTDEEKYMALAAHISPLLAMAFIVPIVLLLVKGNDSKFVKYHCIQALAAQTAGFVVVMTVLFVTCGLGFPIAILPTAVAIWGAVMAMNGSMDGYPLLSGIGR